MQIRKIQHSWGSETVIGKDSRVVRVYQSSKKVTVDLSQIRDKTWNKFQAVQKKYPNTIKIVLGADTPINSIIQWWMS